MDKREEILNFTMENECTEGENEKRIHNRGAIFGFIVALAVAVIMFYVDFLVFHKYDFGKPAIIWSVIATSEIYEGIKFRDKKKMLLGVVFGIFFVVCVFMYIGATL